MIYFVGAGPGDPELLTVKAQRLLREADVVLYAGSLVPVTMLDICKSACRICNSAGLTLAQTTEILTAAYRQGQLCVRLHTGDPSIYGAIREQIQALAAQGISCEVVPGVSSFSAAAAALQCEYTVPEVAQTLILTRAAGRTPVPPLEELDFLAAHQTSLVLFLSIGMIEAVVQKLLTHYPAETPAAVVCRVSQPGQTIVQGTLADIAGRVRAAGIERTALILVGAFLGASSTRSRLYDAHFSHGFRQAEL